MPTTADFLNYAQWAGIATLVFGAIVGLSFFFQWGIRFRLVGATGLMGVLTVGLFALGVVPFTRTLVPGAVRYSTVYDGGSTQAVIVVAPTLTESQLVATLQQAAGDLFSPGRLGRGTDKLTIRARTMLHPQDGVSQPLVLGEIKRSLFDRNDEQIEITVNRESLALLPQPVDPAESAEDVAK